MTTPTIDEPFAWTWIDISGKRQFQMAGPNVSPGNATLLYTRPAPPADVAAAVDSLHAEIADWVSVDRDGKLPEPILREFRALRTKLGVK